MALSPATRLALARGLGRLAAAADRTQASAARAPLVDAARALGAEAWSEVPSWVEAAGLGPAAATALGPLAPSDAAAALRDVAERTLARGRRLAAERAALAVALAAAGVPYRPLKGAWSAERAWSPPEARPMADLDLLVHPEELEAAERALRGLGYAETSRTWKHRRYDRPGARAVVDPRGEHPDNPRPVEVHPALAEALRGIRWTGPAVRAGAPLAEADALAHLLAHASVDAMERRLRLATLVDVARLVTVLEGDTWRAAMGRFEAPKGARFAAPALVLAERELGVRLPAGAQRVVGEAPSALRAWLAAADLDAVSRDGRAEATRGVLSLARVWPTSRREAAAMWRHALFPSRWELADRYPRLAGSPAWPLAYARHAVFSARLAGERLKPRFGRRPPPARGRRAGR